MKLKSRLMMFTAALALSTTMAVAAITTKDVMATYQAQAYTFIRIKEGPTQIKVEAIKNGVKVEVVYDKETGAVLKEETETAGLFEAGRKGAFVRQVGRDFEDNDDGDEDGDDDTDDGDDADDDNDDADDDSNDDDDDNDRDEDDDSEDDDSDEDDSDEE